MAQATALRHSPLPPAASPGADADALGVTSAPAQADCDPAPEGHRHGGAGHSHAHGTPRHPPVSLLRLSLAERLGIVAGLIAALWAAVLTVLG